jgi:valyl-tRNA synthetase
MIKKYWPVAVGLALIVLYFVSNHSQNTSDNAIAQMMADKVMNRHHLAVKKIRDTYAPLQEKASAKIDVLNGELNGLSNLVDNKNRELIKARKQIENLKLCADKLTATNVLLDQSMGFTLYIKNAYKIKVSALNMAWKYKFDLKQGELDDVLVENGKTIAELGAAVKQAVMAKLKLRRRVGIGGFVGISPDGKPTAGVGLTITIIRLPWKI